MSVSDSPSAGTIPAAVVRYSRSTDHRGSRWVATVDRGGSQRFRATVPYDDGPDAAVAAVLAVVSDRLGVAWQPVTRPLSLDGGSTYAYGIANPELSGLPAVRV